MTLRSVVRDGMIDVNGEIPDGTPVRIVRDDKPRRSAKKAKAPAKRTAKKKATRAGVKPKSDPIMKVFGMWKDRPEWKGKSSVEIARELREKALGRRSGRR